MLKDKYKILKYIIFEILEPKHRIVTATRFRDRVWQKAMCDAGLRKALTGSFISDNGACRPGYGTDYCLERIICGLQKHYRKYHTWDNLYYVHLDIKGFYPNTPHASTKAVISKRVHDDKIVSHVHAIIDSFNDFRDKKEIAADPFGIRGTALGSEPAQQMQLALIDPVDHYIKEQIKIHLYYRYNDDFLIMSTDPQKVKQAIEYVTSKLGEHGLIVKNKSGIQPAGGGITFMKKKIAFKAKGKVIIKYIRQKFTAERRKLRGLKRKLDRNELTMDAINRHYQAWAGSARRFNNNREVDTMDQYFAELFETKPKYVYRRTNHVRKSKRSTHQGAQIA